PCGLVAAGRTSNLMKYVLALLSAITVSNHPPLTRQVRAGRGVRWARSADAAPGSREPSPSMISAIQWLFWRRAKHLRSSEAGAARADRVRSRTSLLQKSSLVSAVRFRLVTA